MAGENEHNRHTYNLREIRYMLEIAPQSEGLIKRKRIEGAVLCCVSIGARAICVTSSLCR